MYARILVPTDGSELADKAVQHGLELARRFGSKLIVLRVMAPPVPLVMEGVVINYPVEEVREQALGQIAAYLASVDARAKAAGVTVQTCVAENEQAWRAIIETATAEKVDLIVMASHGRRGVTALVLGSETLKVLTHTTIPVLVCR